MGVKGVQRDKKRGDVSALAEHGDAGAQKADPKVKAAN
jgi:hypothetical protein